MDRKCYVIPKTLNLRKENLADVAKRKTRVCGYARVSTEFEAQTTSIDSQVKVLTDIVNNNPDWELIDFYYDHGITGTGAKKRPGFEKMIADAKGGKIDMIIVKSISRFYRNTAKALQYIQELKQFEVDVYFHEENLHSIKPGDMNIISFLASMAQSESEGLSDNIKWSKKANMERGKVVMSYGSFLGYRKGENGEPEIVPEEAEIVKLIYELYLDEHSQGEIAQILNDAGIPSPRKKSWGTTTVFSILRNEKYKGDYLGQKTFIDSPITKNTIKNTGQLPRYYAYNTHPAIIPKETWALVQAEIARRSGRGRLRSKAVFTHRLVCADCGEYLGHKVWRTSPNNKKDMWRCNGKYERTDGRICQSANVRDETVRKGYLSAMNQILARKADFLPKYEAKLAQAAAEAENKALLTARDEAEGLAHQTRGELYEFLNNRQNNHLDVGEYEKQYLLLKTNAEEAKVAAERLNEDVVKKAALREKLRRFVKILTEIDGEMEEFNDRMFRWTCEKIYVSDDTLNFHFVDGTEIEINIHDNSNAN